jgi:hypothetical protein
MVCIGIIGQTKIIITICILLSQLPQQLHLLSLESAAIVQFWRKKRKKENALPTRLWVSMLEASSFWLYIVSCCLNCFLRAFLNCWQQVWSNNYLLIKTISCVREWVKRWWYGQVMLCALNSSPIIVLTIPLLFFT